MESAAPGWVRGPPRRGARGPGSMSPPEPQPQRTLTGPARAHNPAAEIRAQQAAVVERLANDPDNSELLQQLQGLHLALAKALQEASYGVERTHQEMRCAPPTPSSATFSPSTET